MTRLNARTRWAVPVGALAIVGIVAAATAVADASVPSLPARTAAQLIAEVSQAAAKPIGPFTATVQETANLGLPQLPQIAQPGGTADLASGTQTLNIWYSDPQHVRIAHPVQAGESDLRLNGRTLWLWNSKTQTATKITLPASIGQAGNGAAGGSCPPPSPGTVCATATLTPQGAANQVLKALGPSTVVAVESNVKAPTGPAYQLALEPRTTQSLIGKVVIAIDAKSHLPVSVDVYGRGSAGLVYSVGFTALTLGAPAASNFTFTPPPGATVKTQAVPNSIPSGLLPPGLGGTALKIGGVAVSHASTSVGSVPSALPAGKVPVVPIPKQALTAINAQFAASLPPGMSKAQRAAAIKQFDKQFAVVAGSSSATGPSSGVLPGSSVTFSATDSNANVAAGSGLNNGGGFFGGSTPASAGAPKVLGKDWLSVLATPANPKVAAAIQALLSRNAPASSSTSTGLFGSSSSSSSASSPTSTGPGGPSLAVLQALLLASTPVHGSWGSGRLLQTNVLSVLITSKGQILAGAVTPSVLYADVVAAG